MNKEKIKKILSSKIFKVVVYVLGFLIVASFIFQAGMVAGFKKANFGRDWGRNYEMNFGRPEMGPRMMGGHFDDFGNLPNSHGAIGKIIKLDQSSIVVLDIKDNTEKVIVFGKDTQVKKARENLNLSDLKLDEDVIVIGVPNSLGQIEAKLLRIIVAPFESQINKIEDTINRIK